MWPKFFAQFEKNKVSYEFVFAGPVKPDFELPSNAKFIHFTPDRGLGPACQCAANHSRGETMLLIADDCIFCPDFLDKMYAKYKESNDYKCMPAARWCGANGKLAADKVEELIPENDITDTYWQIRTVPGRTDIYFALTLWSRKFFYELGGYDRRFIIAPYDADMQLRSFSHGGHHEWVYDALWSEPLGPESRAWNRWGGMFEIQELMFKRWYSNGQFMGGTFLGEPRTPFEPYPEGSLP